MASEFELKEYLLKEYDILKDAHFQTSQSITTFFQYAIIILSAPLVLLPIDKIALDVLSIGFIAIGLVGFCIMLYLSQLRYEALLYARNINKVRNKIYTEILKTSSQNEIHFFKVLLSQEKKPKYSNWWQFGFIVCALSILNSFYLGYGLYKIIQLPGNYSKFMIDHVTYISIITAFFFFFFHFIAHKIVSIRNENGSDYFKRIIGVDIDGVLNEHEQHFVALYNEMNVKPISIEDIKTLPIYQSGVITKLDEQKVFHKEEYWSDMPLREDVESNLIHEIKNKRGYKIYLFTWRDWELDNSSKTVPQITKMWLKNKKIEYDKLKFEKGNYDRPITVFSSKYRTRYYYSNKFNVRYFVEDSVENAIRLSQICEYVFLIEHQYNVSVAQLPYNIIKVKDWGEVLEWIKKLD